MRLLTLFATTIALFGVVTPPAEAQAVRCGDSLTRSVSLTADLVCADVGLVVAADGVVLDLGGHQLTGTTALQVKDVRRTVVRNGTITGHRDVGVRLENTRGATFSGMTIAAGITATEARNTLLSKVAQGTR